jgi:uncharacterized membrane protein
VTSFADTTVPDPFAPDFCFDPDCLIAHGFRWKHGVKTDLGALDNDFSSVAGSLNERGWIVGCRRRAELILYWVVRRFAQCCGNGIT